MRSSNLNKPEATCSLLTNNASRPSKRSSKSKCRNKAVKKTSNKKKPLPRKKSNLSPFTKKLKNNSRTKWTLSWKKRSSVLLRSGNCTNLSTLKTSRSSKKPWMRKPKISSRRNKWTVPSLTESPIIFSSLVHTQIKWNKFILKKTYVRANVKTTSIFLKNAMITGRNARKRWKSMSVKRTKNFSKNKINATSIATNCRPAVLPSLNAKMPLKMRKSNPKIPSRTKWSSIAAPTKWGRSIWRA